MLQEVYLVFRLVWVGFLWTEVDLSGWMRTSRKGMEPSGVGCAWVKVRSLVRESRKERKASAWGLSLNAPRLLAVVHEVRVEVRRVS